MLCIEQYFKSCCITNYINSSRSFIHNYDSKVNALYMNLTCSKIYKIMTLHDIHVYQTLRPISKLTNDIIYHFNFMNLLTVSDNI